MKRAAKTCIISLQLISMKAEYFVLHVFILHQALILLCYYFVWFSWAELFCFVWIVCSYYCYTLSICLQMNVNIFWVHLWCLLCCRNMFLFFTWNITSPNQTILLHVQKKNHFNLWAWSCIFVVVAKLGNVWVMMDELYGYLLFALFFILCVNEASDEKKFSYICYPPLQYRFWESSQFCSCWR